MSMKFQAGESRASAFLIKIEDMYEIEYVDGKKRFMCKLDRRSYASKPLVEIHIRHVHALGVEERQ